MSFRHHLVRWEDEFAKEGLVIVEVSGGELSSFDRSKKLIVKQELKHPVLWDKDNSNHKNYGINSWPAAYLIGADGKVFWEGNPSWVRSRPDELANMRKLLQENLKAARLKSEAAH